MINIPFSGTKRYSYRQVKPLVEKYKYKTVYEPFGGSCVLSVNLYNDKLVDRAIVNDYDRFFDRYEEYLDLKDKVVSEGLKRGLVKSYANRKHGAYIHDENDNIVEIPTQTLYGREREILQEIISEYVPQDFWKYFVLGSNFTHSGTYNHKTIELKDFCMFGNYLNTDKQRYYLSKLNECEINNLDYKDFIKKYASEFNRDTLIICDPPYIGTCQEQYEHTFTEQETVELIGLLQLLPCDYIFFNRNLKLIEKWFTGIDCSINRTGRGKTSPFHDTEEYLVFVRKDNIFFLKVSVNDNII